MSSAAVVRVLVIILASLCATANAATIYVSTTGSDANDGQTWSAAKKTVQAGLDTAAPGDQLWVAAGTYVENVRFKVDVALYGGFAGTEASLSQRNWTTNLTILDGNRQASVITIPRGVALNSPIDGFTIRNGNATSGGGIDCEDGSPTIANNMITGNSASYGGGIRSSGTSPTIINNTISGNKANTRGGGIDCTSGTISHNTISGNVCADSGGGIDCSFAVTIEGNTITGNSARSGGAIHCFSSSAIADNTICGNSASSGGGIYFWYASPTVAGNTIAGNSASYGGALYCDSSSPTVVNTIIAFNSSGIHNTGSGTPSVRYSCIYGNTAYDSSGLTDPAGANGNISADPQLAGAMYGNLHIQPGSPCRDAGNDSAIQPASTDMDGQPRKQGSHVDIGADESDGTTWPGGPNLIVRVGPTGNDANDGSSWSMAKRSVQAAIDATAVAGGEVWVAAGTYAERITLRDLVHVYGGFAGTEADRSGRDGSRNVTVLDGGQAGSVVTANRLGYALSTLDGFTIRNGNATGSTPSGSGGGVCCVFGSPAILNNAFTGNKAYESGGGISCYASSPRIEGNTITGNSSSGNGGGIYCSASSPTIAGNTITGNKAYNDGGGIYCDSGFLTITNNTIADNDGYYGGGIYCWYDASGVIAGNAIRGNTASTHGGGIYCCSPLVIATNTISGNSVSQDGGGIYCSSASPTILNNTITGNSIAGTFGSGGGMYCDSSASPTVVNTIIAFNSSGICSDGGTPSFGNNCVYGNPDYNYSGLADPTGTNGNISADPKLANLLGGNLHIQPGSPCRDAGDDSTAQPIATDADGQPRKQGLRVDIGADESDGTTWPSGPSRIIRVTPTGNDVNDGSSWSLAKRSVQAAISAAASAEVWVAAGTYAERITLRDQVHVYGGFAGTEADRSSRDWSRNVTILDGGQAGSVVTASQLGYALSTLDGFTIRNGSGTVSSYDRYGGAVYCSSASPTIRNNALADNSASHGAGVYCTNSRPTIESNTIVRNSASNTGGGIYCSYSSPTITLNTIMSNSSLGVGAGIACESSSLTIVNNVIKGNRASGYGGGIYCSSFASVTVLIANNTIAGNSGSSAAGVYLYRCSPTIANNTICGNAASASYSNSRGDVYCDSSSPTIVNTIIAFNSSGICNSGSGTPVLRYNCIYGNAGHDFIDVADPTGSNGNISADPKLAALRYGSLHIQPDSPCINAGDDTILQTGWTDMDGQVRRQGLCVDIGADEADGSAWPSGPNRIVRVALTGNDANDGSSWSLTKRSVQAAIDAAAAVGGEVWIAAGTYLERIQLRPFAHVFGGFAGTESQRTDRNWQANATILDGQQAGTVVTAAGIAAGMGTLDGLVVRNGNAGDSTGSHGGGILCSGGSLTIANSTITGNIARYAEGGGIYCAFSSPIIANTNVTGNSAAVGAGIYCSSGCFPLIVNTTITGNRVTSGDGGGGIYCNYASPTIIGCTISGNSASEGGGVYCNNAPTTIVNTIIAFNSSGIRAFSYGNTPLSLKSNCVYGNALYNYLGLDDPTGINGNVSSDPRLARAYYADVHIQPDSPCVDAGDDTILQADWTDMDGQSRLLGAHVDIGADESDGTLWPPGPVAIIRVSPQGSDTNDGSSWPLAKRTIQAGINAAAASGGQIWVAAGTYLERIILTPGVTVYGGFASTETDLSQRNWVDRVTILDGNRTGSVVTAGPGVGQNAGVDGFTIRGGTDSGIHCYKSSPTIANNRITANGGTDGGGIYCTTGSPVLVGNAIFNNTVSGNGGGIYCTSASPTITGNRISDNTASRAGGGIYCSASSAVITSNTITGNMGQADGGGIYCTRSSSLTITNTIVAFNFTGVYIANGAAPTLQYNCVYGNYIYNYSGIADPTGANGNISTDPLLVRLPDPGPDYRWGTADDIPGDWHLMPGSPCINAGDPGCVPMAGESDFDGQPRKIGSRVDIGADEFCWTGDTNLDGYVNVGDLQTLVAAWATHKGDAAYNPAADCNSDSVVNASDLQLLVANWGKSIQPSGPVPG